MATIQGPTKPIDLPNCLANVSSVEAIIVDLHCKNEAVLQALDRNEEVRGLYRGQLRGRILPARKSGSGQSVEAHPFFGSAEPSESVADVVHHFFKPFKPSAR
ncbi:MAG: type II toxin-antitoxin system Phd/YefM family antitoxin [Verrucomicrobia bacterium]|jgi:hypothetical protein|nr:type II toxin-antitoxin system Phd/YefM family antitoxin [Verrucomicrobiota bacterium]